MAIGGIWHETNTFANTRTTFADFAAYQVASGRQLLSRFEKVRNEIGGMIAGAAQNEIELVPTWFAGAVPSGIVERETYENLGRAMEKFISEAREIEGMLLVLHGAMVAEGVLDVEADLLQQIRTMVGIKPIVATFDIHANLSAAMVKYTDVLIGYDTYPHVDVYERGVEAAHVMARILRGDIHPTVAFEKIPLLSVPQAQHTSQSPMREIMARRAEIENDPRVITASVAVGYPYSDIPDAGMSVVVTTNDAPELAQQYAAELREMIWARREQFVVKNMPVDEAVQRAIEDDDGPLILVDVADNIGGGSPGDGTVLLEKLLAAHAQNTVVTIADVEAVAQAIDAGIDNQVMLRVGGKTDDMHGAPVEVRGRVRLISSGEYIHKGSYMTGTVMRMGHTVVLDCNGIDLVLMERKTMPFDAQQLRSLGIEPADKKIIVMKSAIAWQAAYGDIAQAAYYVDTPGICTANLKTLPYKNVRRPIFPLDG